MKRGKDEEKILEPMFPRLHVNDADKGGGPRAPPRNKMALYEQLSIPSQRFNDRTSASFPRNTSTTLVSPGPSNQACGVERKNLTGRATDNFVSQMPLMENVRTSSSQQRGDQRKIVREEDDFAVPVFVNSRRSGRSSNKSGIDKEKDTTSKRGGLASSSGRVDGCETTTRVVGVNNGVESHMASEEEEEEEGHSGGYTSLQQINEEEASEDVSDDSMVDSVSSVDVSPDDVVGVLGQKRFWRARKAIANQQRVFAVQLFELHRLIKVQKLIAASPDVLLDDISYLGKVAAPVKKLLPSGFIVKPPLPQAIKRRSSGDSEKTDQNKMECSAENVVGRLSSQGDHHHHQPSNYMPFATNQPTANGCYYPPPQPQPLPSGGNQQWLIPVMSPSEGLIYKPHPGPGHTGPVCGGYYGHFMPAPMVMGSFMGGGGGQPPPFHPGMGFPSHGNNGYFPPYGIMMNPYYSGQQQQQPPSEQMNNNIQQQQQSSVNEAASQQQQQQQPTKSYPRARKSRQGSTGSSPEGIISGKKNSFRPFSAADKINSAPEEMMTTTTTTTTTVTQTTRDGAGVTRVIKVVPHNANLASENAARIFRSIQEERKQYDDAFADYP